MSFGSVRGVLYTGAACLALLAVGRGVASAGPAPTTSADETQFYAAVRAHRSDDAVRIGARVRAEAPLNERFALDYAFALLAAGRKADAQALLTTLSTSTAPAVRAAAAKQLAAMLPPPPAPALTPSPAQVLLQLAYSRERAGDRKGAVVALDRYLAMEPAASDTVRLQRAYDLAASDQPKAAHTAFVSLRQSADPTVRQAVLAQLAASAVTVSRLDVFSYAQGDSRFDDLFYGASARLRLAPTRIEPYLAFSFANDTRSGTAPQSQIYNDNTFVPAIGVRAPIGASAAVFIEAGRAFSLLGKAPEDDLRYGIVSSSVSGRGLARSQTHIDASVAHYSRYVNTIGYAGLVHDFAIGAGALRGVAGVDLVLDTSRAFYNNALDEFAGVQIHRGGLTIRLAAVHGDYLARGTGLTANASYWTFRPQLLYGFSH